MASLRDLLSIFVVTYNRAESLDRTLTSLATGRFAGCRLTVLDNHSSDATAAVCARHAAANPDLRIVRHRSNLGMTPNYLRAVELSDTPYTWVVGDDDDFDFSRGADVEERLFAGDADLLIVGAVGQEQWAIGRMRPAVELFNEGFPYFHVTGWFTGVIFRTALFNDACFQQGYKNADNAFPHFPFYADCFTRNVRVYLAAQWVTRAREVATGYGRLGSEMIAGYVNSMRAIPDASVRRRAILEGPVGQGRVAGHREAMLLFFKVFGIHRVMRPANFLATWFKIFAPSPWDIRLMLLPSLGHRFVPRRVANALWSATRGAPARTDERATEAAILDEART